MKTIIYSVALSFLVACAPASRDAGTQAENSSGGPARANEAARPAAPAAPPVKPVTAEENKPMSYYQDKVAEIHTSKGEIDVRFFPDVAPNHVKNFIDLAEKGFYNGSKFHRVIPGFMIQGGDPNTISGDPSSWGTGGSGKHVSAEFNSVHHKRGILSMARSQDPNSASSQFFVMVAEAGFLDNKYSAFGEVTKGMEVADVIVNAPRGANDRPNDPVSIESIKVRPAREDEKGPTPK